MESSPLTDSPKLLSDSETKSESIENKCEICGKILSNKKNLKKHYKLHLNLRDYVCTICNKSYKRSDHLKRHMVVHDPEPNYYECEYCLKKFNFNYHLTAHLKNVHFESKQKQYECEKCHLFFNKKRKLYKHQNTEHQKVIEKIPCYFPYCNKSYITKQKLEDHIKKFHMSNLNNNIVQDQNEIIFKNNNISNENNINDNNNDINENNDDFSEKNKKYFRCPYKECLKVYSSHYNLSVHIKTFHLKIKSFACELCDNKYYHKVSLKKHLLMEHKCNNDDLEKHLNNSLYKSNNELKNDVFINAKKKLIEDGIMTNNDNFENNSIEKNNSSEKNAAPIFNEEESFTKVQEEIIEIC